MEEQANESNLEKDNIEKDEIPPDTELNKESKENSAKEEVEAINQDKEEISSNQEKEPNSENNDNDEDRDEQNDEELDEIADDIHQELNEEIKEVEENENEQEVHEEHVEAKDEEDIHENPESADYEPEPNEEAHENPEENPENNEEEDSQNEQEEHEYKERQAIHIHRQEEENGENAESSNQEEKIEDSGKIHPMQPVESKMNQDEEENNENKEEEPQAEEEENEENENIEQENEPEIEKEKEEENEEENAENISHEISKSPQKEDNTPTKEEKIITKKEIIKSESKREELPKRMVFKSITREENKSNIEKVETEVNYKEENYHDFVEIPLSEKEKYANIETIELKGGMETGEYKFLSSEKELTHINPAIAKVAISKEEILNEINRRRNKQKKISYEIIDKYFSLTVFDEKIEISANQQEHEVKESKPEDNFSKYLIEQINKIRADPQSFIGVIEDAKDNIKKNKRGRYYYNGNNIKVALREGESAFDEAIEFLKSCKPMNPLTFSNELIPSAPKTEEEIEDRNYLKKSVDKMMHEGIRINSYWRDFVSDAEICFLLMIIDDNGNNKGLRRNDILNPYLKNIGISSFEVDGYFVNYFILN